MPEIDTVSSPDNTDYPAIQSQSFPVFQKPKESAHYLADWTILGRMGSGSLEEVT